MENSKITRLALSLKFNAGDIDSIMEIIEASGNAQVATEILLGVYEAPEICSTTDDSETEVNRVLVNYNKFTDMVEYSYNRKTNVKAFFKIGEENFIKENIISSKIWLEDACRDLGITSEEFKTKYTLKVYEEKIEDTLRNSSMGLLSWQNVSSPRSKISR